MYACYFHETLHFKINVFDGKAVQRGSTLKAAVFGQLSDQVSTQNFFFYKTHIRLAKKSVPVRFCVF
jgi:hypothetical protein